MHAFLIIGNSEEYISEACRTSFVKKLEGRKIEFPFAKVIDLKELNNFIKLTLSEKTNIILRDFDKSTTEAQNAFLKALEEPQKNLTYILTAKNIDKVLPTIISRCEVVELKSEKVSISDDEKNNANDFINGEVGKKLSIIAKINKREDAIYFVNNLIIAGHERFLKDIEMGEFLNFASVALKNLEANGNVQLQLTNFVVNVSTILTMIN